MHANDLRAGRPKTEFSSKPRRIFSHGNIKFILDCRAVKEGAAAPLKVSIGHQRKTALLPLNINLTPDQWDAGAEKVVKHPNRVSYNQIIARRRVEIIDIINDLTNRPGGIGQMTATELKNTVRDTIAPRPAKEETAPKDNPNSVANYFVRYKENKGLAERTAEMYDVTWRRIEAWLGKEAAAALVIGNFASWDSTHLKSYLYINQQKRWL